LTLIVAASITLSIKSNFVWKDPITFYNNILKYNEGTARVHNNLAMAYADIKDFKSAEKHYLKAIEIADTYPQTHYNLARLYLRFGKIERAISHLERSIEINPNFFFSYQLLGNIYEHLKRYDLANDYYKKAKSIKFY
jgi:tetratricopeptide (TPR) repeat protein